VNLMKKKPFFKMLSLYLIFAIVLLTIPAQGWAMFVPTAGSVAPRQTDMTTIQKTLESTVVKQRLMDYGLSPEEAMVRISRLSDEQTHQLASNMDSLQAGADGGLDAVIFLLVVAIIVVLVLELTGHHVVFR
jgi:exopolysaccharide biosynthesis protein